MQSITIAAEAATATGMTGKLLPEVEPVKINQKSLRLCHSVFNENSYRSSLGFLP